jgi:hypothetical protein
MHDFANTQRYMVEMLKIVKERAEEAEDTG